MERFPLKAFFLFDLTFVFLMKSETTFFFLHGLPECALLTLDVVETTYSKN